MTLQEKLAERKRQEAAVTLRRKLKSMPGLVVEGFDNSPDLLPPQELWRRFSSYARDPQHRIRHETFADTGRSVLKQWLDSLGHPTVLHLSVGGHGELPWLRVTLEDSFSLFDLFNTVGDFIALDAESNKALGILDDEHDKLVFLESQVGRS